MSIKQKAIKGVKWTTLATFVLAITSILKLSVLTRFLDKTDFGLMALVTFVLGFANLFMDMGLTSAILHKQNITKNQYSSLFWLNLLFSIFLYVFLIGLAPIFSSFYKEPELKQMIFVLGLSLIISALGRQFKTIEQKELNFKFISIVEIVSGLFSLGVAVVLAIQGAGVWALVYSALFQFILSNLVFMRFGIIKHGIKLHFAYSETKPFLRIGMYQVGGQVINYFNRDLDALIIGKFFGTDILGGYSLAKQLVFKPLAILNPILTKVAAPTLAKFQESKVAMRQNYLKLVNIVASLNFIIYAGIIAFASPIVILLYGNNYEHVVIIVRILSIYMFFRSVSNPIGSLVIANGRTDVEFYWNLFILPIFPLAVLVGCQFSIEWVATLLTCAMILLQIPFWYFLIKKMLDVGFKEYFNKLIPSTKLFSYSKIIKKNQL